MLRVKELNKTYASGVQALRGINLEISAGVFGLLGPNGAGKTTLMKILATLLDPDSGDIAVNDIDFISQKMAARRMLGYLPQDFGLYPTLTAEQTLTYFARLKGVAGGQERARLIDALLERVNLTSARKQPVGGFSGGMRQRLGIAQALIGRPGLIIVDEPTAGLDPEERNRFHNLLAEIADADTVVLLSTHIVSDVSNLCSTMAIIRHGEILAFSTPRAALARIATVIWETTVPREQVTALKSRFKVISTQLFEGQVRVRAFSPEVRPSGEFSPVVPTLEDYYFSVINQGESVH
ncbi:MAG: type transport system ATP-binding protein [Acidobacteriota bacterium]|jgi:ABC-type multidrug transport system ATPase subunit|nr:type transport system ATP-binding protein [Acidobacteriota bacterium]